MTSHAFEVYRRMARLFSRGVHIVDMMRAVNISEVYLYGIGEMGRIVLEDLNDSGMVRAAFDKNIASDETFFLEEFGEIKVESPKHIPDDTTPILVSPSRFLNEIIYELVNMGVEASRLFSLNALLQIGEYYYLTKAESIPDKCPMEFLITGVSFENKGSQAMTFVAMDELRKRYGDVIIWIRTYDDRPEYCSRKYKAVFLSNEDAGSGLIEIMPRMSAVIDVSGYSWASTKGFGASDTAMEWLRLAYDFGIPYFMMPQSFGPLDFPRYKLAEMRELLSAVDTIYAREEEGVELLRRLLSLQNVVKSNDMVLQSKGIEIKNIYADGVEGGTIDIKTTHNVAVVPNSNLCRYLGEEDTIGLFNSVIDKMIDLKKNIYIISHSGDQRICWAIYKNFIAQGQVQLFQAEFDCLEFSNIICNFEYLIASRFHAIIHAYKLGKPCLIIGWAEKYRQLASDFEQEKYLFDARKTVDIELLIAALKEINSVFLNEGVCLKQKIKKYQQNNCFDIVQRRIARK